MSSTETKKSPVPSLRPQEELEQLLAAYEKEHPDRFVFGWETRTDLGLGKNSKVPYIVIHRVEDCTTVEIPDFVRGFSVLPGVTWEVETESPPQEEAAEEQDDSSQPKQPAPVGYCYFKSNVAKISGGAGLHSIAALFQHVNFNHTLDVSQLVVSNVSDMSGAFADCFIKELTGLRDWSDEKNKDSMTTVFNVRSMFRRAKIETLDSMFSLVALLQSTRIDDDCLNIFYDAKIGTIKDKTPWDNLPCDNYNFSQRFFNNAIIPDLGLDRNQKKREENAMAFFHTSPYLQNKEKEQTLSLATIVSCCQLIESTPKEKNVTTLEDWFQAYPKDPWEAKFSRIVFEDFLEIYHKSNPKVFEYQLDSDGHVRIKKFLPDVWKETAFYHEMTIVIPDFVYGFGSNAFEQDCVQGKQNYLYDGTLHFKLGKNVRDLSNMFSTSSIAPHLVLDDWDTSKVTKMDSMFWFSNFQSIRGLENFDTSQVTSMSSMFAFFGFNSPAPCSKYILDGLKTWNTSRVESMELMFSGACIEELNLCNWNVENVKSLFFLFSDCTSLKHLNLRNWNLNSATALSYLFDNCKKLETLDVSNWALPEKVVKGCNLFSRCLNLTTLDLSSWDFSRFSSLSGMFELCGVLRFSNPDEMMADWDISNVKSMVGMFRDCGISLEDPKRLRDLWERKKHPECDVASAFHDMVYGKKNSAKELEISDFMPNLNLHYEIFTWADEHNTRKEDN